MEIRVEHDGALCRVAITGELTIYSAADCKAQLVRAVDTGAALEIQADGITELDTAGVQVLLLAKRATANAGKPFRLVSPSATVEEVLKTMAFSHSLECV